MNDLTPKIKECQEQWPLLDFRDGYGPQGIAILKPQFSRPKNERRDNETGTTAWLRILEDEIGEITKCLGVNLLMADTVTAIGHHLLAEMTAVDGNRRFGPLKAPKQEHYGLTQRYLREWFRDPQVWGGLGCHVVHIMHQETAKKSAGKDSSGEAVYTSVQHGPNGGGPSSVQHYGTEFRTVNRVYSEGEKRYLQLQPFTDQYGVPYAARTNAGTSIPNKKLIPEGYKGTVELLKWLLDVMGIEVGKEDRCGYLTWCLYGLQSVGKTYLASCLMAHMRPALIIAADGGSEGLGSVPNEIKEGTA